MEAGAGAEIKVLSETPAKLLGSPAPKRGFLTALGPPCAPWAPEGLKLSWRLLPTGTPWFSRVDVVLEFEALDLDRFAGRAGSVALLLVSAAVLPVAGAQERQI